MLAVCPPLRQEGMKPGLIAVELLQRRIPGCPLMPKSRGQIVDPGPLLRPKVDYPERVTAFGVAIGDGVGDDIPRPVPFLLLRMRADALRLQSLELVRDRL